MNMQLMFQVLIYEALSEGIEVNTARELTLFPGEEKLGVKTGGEYYVVGLETPEEQLRIRKRYQIESGPDAGALETHLKKVGQRGQNVITFTCPTFGECTPDHAKFKGESIDVSIGKIIAHEDGVLTFQGVAYIVTDESMGRDTYPNGLPIAGKPVHGTYDTKNRVGWMSPRRFTELQIYI